MININISRAELEAIQMIDIESLRDCINRCKVSEFTHPLREFRLYHSGPYISECEHRFNLAIASHHTAKSSKKRSETQYSVDKAANDLISAVEIMKSQADKQLSEQCLYVVDDEIFPTLGRLTRNLRVRVTFRWREAESDHWKIGSIIVTHTTRPDPRYDQPVKQSRIKNEQGNQDDLYRTWEFLAGLTKCAVRDHFRDGKSGSLIPAEFEAVPDSYSGGLNNHSVKF
ncbi:hypothetical protein [Pectobacterium brasiliense]|uniref:hypothetical protein n=1 Tax=Pectobacterium brasiliense TaxID=180957 RepID=UPI003872DEF7